MLVIWLFFDLGTCTFFEIFKLLVKSVLFAQI